jgi:hypothetical protein
MPRLPLLLIALLLAACNASANGSPTPTLVPTSAVFSPTDDTSSETPFLIPTLPPTPTPTCPGAPETRLILHERGRVLPDDPRPVNLRHEPGRDNRWILQIPVRGVFYVLDGPVCEGDFAWFKVNYDGNEGWIAEGELAYYYVEPYLVG